MSHDPSEIILIYWSAAQEIFIIINVENSCFFIILWKTWFVRILLMKRKVQNNSINLKYKCFVTWYMSLLWLLVNLLHPGSKKSINFCFFLQTRPSKFYLDFQKKEYDQSQHLSNQLENWNSNTSQIWTSLWKIYFIAIFLLYMNYCIFSVHF